MSGVLDAWQRVARWAWLGLLVAIVLRLWVTVRIFLAEVHVPCVDQSCQGPPSLTREQMDILQASGISLDVYATYCAAVVVCFVALNCALAGVILWRRPADPMASFTALTLTLYAGFSLGLPDQLFRVWEPTWWPPVSMLALLGGIALMVLFYLFPDGRPVPRWVSLVIAIWSVQQAFSYLAPSAASELGSLAGPLGGPLAAIPPLTTWASVLYAQVYRYRHVSTSVQRAQTRWVVYGITMTIVGWVPLLAFYNSGALGSNPFVDVGSWTVGHLIWLVLPVSISVAILRDRLWDIDIVVKRTLVYGALTVMVVGVYVLTVGYLGTLFRTGDSLAISLVATGLVAVLFQPAREWLQRGINHLMYGERDDPYAVLSRLGQRLEATLAPEAALATIVETIAQALKLPYAAIGLRHGQALVTAASFGSPVPSPLRLPLAYQRESVGELVLGPRGRGDEFTPADRRLLDDIARQVEVAVHAAQATVALQRSRERLVAAREEERRRLRRDLHDGIGPALAAPHRL